MHGYILRRLGGGVLVVLGLLVFAFVVTHYIGDPLFLLIDPETSTEEDKQRIIAANGFDRPFHEQFVDFFGAAVRGDFGESILQNRPAADVAFERLPGTLILTALAMGTTFALAIPAAIVAVRYHGRWPELAVTTAGTAFAAVPSFWLALGLIFVFAVRLSLVPTSGFGSWNQLVLPVAALSLPAAGQIAQVIQASLLAELRRPYVATARAKGLAERVVMYRHVLRNTAIVAVTLFGSLLAALLNGTVIIESIFAVPGLGQVGLQAVQDRDLPVLMATVLYVGIVVTVLNLLVDIAYAYVDPRLGLR